VSDAGHRPRGPRAAEDVRLGDFPRRGADAVVGRVDAAAGDGRVEVRFALLDAVKQVQLASMSYIVTQAQFRATGTRSPTSSTKNLPATSACFRRGSRTSRSRAIASS
jgi:hypothetical protein